jgi:hypothetical protein
MLVVDGRRLMQVCCYGTVKPVSKRLVLVGVSVTFMQYPKLPGALKYEWISNSSDELDQWEFCLTLFPQVYFLPGGSRTHEGSDGFLFLLQQIKFV